MYIGKTIKSFAFSVVRFVKPYNMITTCIFYDLSTFKNSYRFTKYIFRSITVGIFLGFHRHPQYLRKIRVLLIRSEKLFGRSQKPNARYFILNFLVPLHSVGYFYIIRNSFLQRNFGVNIFPKEDFFFNKFQKLNYKIYSI